MFVVTIHSFTFMFLYVTMTFLKLFVRLFLEPAEAGLACVAVILNRQVFVLHKSGVGLRRNMNYWLIIKYCRASNPTYD